MFKIIKYKTIKLIIAGSYLTVATFCIASFIQIFTGSEFGRQSEAFDFILSFSWLVMFEILLDVKEKN